AALDVAAGPPPPSELPSLADSIRRATSRGPRLREVLAELRAEEAETRSIDAELRPDVSATATLSGRAGGAPPSSGAAASGDGFIPNVPNWDVGVVLTWPLFDGVVNAQRAASGAREGVRREELDLVQREQVAEVRKSYVAVDVARA